MARIGIDASPISSQGKGVSRRTLEFLRALSKIPNPNRYLIFLNAGATLPDLPESDSFQYIPIRFPTSLAWEQWHLPRLAAKHSLDLLHTPYDRLPFLARCPVIAHYPEIPEYRLRLSKQTSRSLHQRLSEGLTRILFPLSLKKACRVVVSSKSTQRDLVEKYNTPPGKIRIVYEAASPFFCPGSALEKRNIRDEVNAPEGYVLHFASGDSRDNTSTVLAAYAGAIKPLQHVCPLVIGVRSDQLWSQIETECRALGIARHVTRVENVTEEKLLRLYQGARLYFDPSLFEGFGLQVIEAMACGIPVLASNAASLPEVAGNAAILANPHDVSAFEQGLSRFFQHEDLQQQMAKKSLSQSKKFSWETHAKSMLDLFDEVLKN